ncbi:prephenate dehydrogenase/arogenate dehydrogenase family protein [Methylobacterium sp. J-068]|uniref:prephenate dehydrogenase/arogenate dehydrogenase family protein n=1 Tax=Methylobacterium sp. J-068 TaxID=2836649 RepID=UPI001FBBEE90|nr:prephenate dehydrogenase [Methylobacterium sp. J-068]MCJ2033704.1 prephenate dehydrogenase [Methylobacterium sp. J-068]
MSSRLPASSRAPLGLIGFGAFGRLIAGHLSRHFHVHAYDPGPAHDPTPADIVPASLAEAAACPIVILATPVSAISEVVAAIRPHLRPGVLVLDVGSVKMVPARIMAEGLPAGVAIVATHPLFGPQSARAGLRGAKIAVCEVRGGRAGRVAAFLRRAFGLDAILTTPEAHDRDAATVQGLTHLIARALVQMEPLPTRMTTPSFDRLMQAVEMVRHDAPEVFDAIERANPYVAEIHRRFVAQTARLVTELAPEGTGLVRAA